MAAAPELIQNAADALFRARRIRSQYRQVFGTEDGKAVLENIAKEAGMFDDRIGETEQETYTLLGERRLFLRIAKLLNLSDEQLRERFLPRGEDHE